MISSADAAREYSRAGIHRYTCTPLHITCVRALGVHQAHFGPIVKKDAWPAIACTSLQIAFCSIIVAAAVCTCVVCCLLRATCVLYVACYSPLAIVSLVDDCRLVIIACMMLVACCWLLFSLLLARCGFHVVGCMLLLAR